MPLREKTQLERMNEAYDAKRKREKDQLGQARTSLTEKEPGLARGDDREAQASVGVGTKRSSQTKSQQASTDPSRASKISSEVAVTKERARASTGNSNGRDGSSRAATAAQARTTAKRRGFASRLLPS